MWESLPEEGRMEYKNLILAFASLSEMFAQKATGEGQNIAPIVNSKFQETVFQRAFNALGEDIGNTSYDVSLQYAGEKYLVGIKTFGISSGDQKIIQYKQWHGEWSKFIDEMQRNADGVNDKAEIDKKNASLYMELAKEISRIRNEKIESARANLKGFRVDSEDNNIHSVYHVLMPSDKTQENKIFVGETSYDKIDIDNLQVMGCTSKDYPTNFFFTDGKHIYKYTSADSQLYMKFNNKEIVCEEWDVKYAEDAYAIFTEIANMVYRDEDSYEIGNSVNYEITLKRKKEPSETYCWTIWNEHGEVELYSGFNSFYGTGSKINKEQRQTRVKNLEEKYTHLVSADILQEVLDGVSSFLLETASSSADRAKKAELRNRIVDCTKMAENLEFESEIKKVIYRPMDEMYIPIPDSARFHRDHPNFFGKGFGKLEPGSAKLALPKEQRQFNLVFEPSGDSLPVYITQDYGKAIESAEKQSYLGEWILRGVFQLDEYEPLTAQKLKELNINGLKFSKYDGSNDIHVEFIWIDETNPPKGYIARV